MSRSQPFPVLGDDDISILGSSFAAFFQQISSLSQVQTESQTPHNTTLCSKCRSLNFSRLLDGFEDYGTVEALTLSSFACPLCRIFLGALDQTPENWWGDEPALDTDVVFLKLITDARELNKFPERLEVSALRSVAEVEQILEQDQWPRNPEIRRTGHVIVCVPEKYPIASNLRIRPLREEADCDENIQLVKSWLETCENSHEECHSQGHGRSFPQLPVRVIDVGPPDDSEDPKLLQTATERGRWVALSYKWGPPNFLKLLKGNIAESESGIPLSSMPRTFKDIVKLTRRLGLRYLWIDALCIVQDSEEDWRAQSSQMPNIYAEAYITVASAANESPLEGLFDKRDYNYTHAPSIKLDLGPEGILQFTLRHPHHSASGENADIPSTKDHLSTRGWCLQERVLSRRLLTFHPTEIIYTCGKQILFESYYDQDPIWQLKQRGPFGNNIHRFEDGDGAWKNDFFAIVSAAAHEGTFPNENRDMVLQERQDEADQGKVKGYMNTTPALTNLQKLQERWYTILHDYTGRDLTYDKDKLVAISGVAKYILSRSGLVDDAYHAGTFKSMLPYALMWKIPVQKRIREPWPNHRAVTYRAPTWSWACMDGWLDFERCWKYLNEVPTCEVVEMESTAAWGDACNAVSSGKIRIRGKSVLAIVNTQNDNLCHSTPEEVGAKKAGYVGIGARHLDERPSEERSVVCLELFRGQGLLLVRKEGGEDGTWWERVGIYSMNDFYRPKDGDPVKEFDIV